MSDQLDLEQFENAPKTLDFSQFPNIVPQDDEEELASVARNLTSIQEAYENFSKLITSFIHNLQNYDTKIRYLSTVEGKMMGMKRELAQQDQELTIRENNLKPEREYVDKANEDLRKREVKLEENKLILEEIKKEKLEWERKKQEAQLVIDQAKQLDTNK